MKAKILTVTSLLTLVALTSISDARPHWKREAHRANKLEKKAEKRAAREEAALSKKDFAEEATHGDDATPILNAKQRKLEKRIATGESTGRLSKGEASSLRRKLDSLARYEATLKSGQLSSHERERLHEKSIELTRELNKQLTD